MANTKDDSSNDSSPGVQVIPVSDRDQWIPIDNIRTIMYFVVDSVLDEKMLRSGLDGLIRNYWPKLGGRLKRAKGNKGPLEYHVPDVFPDGYQLFAWSSRTVDGFIHQASALPRATRPEEGITLHAPITAVEQAWAAPDWPLERKAEAPDAPLLWIHLTHYADATVVGLNGPHVLADQLGYGTIVKAWLQVVRGMRAEQQGKGGNLVQGEDEKRDNEREGQENRAGGTREENERSEKQGAETETGKGKEGDRGGKEEEEEEDDIPPPFLELGATLDGPGDLTEAELRRKGRYRVTNKLHRLAQILAMLPALAMHPRERRHTLFLPGALVESLRCRRNKSLQAQYGSGTPFVTNGDIVAGILIKFSQFRRRRPKTISASSAINLRGRVPQLPPGQAYVHNAITFNPVRFRGTASTPLAEVAYRHRLAIIEGVERRNVEIGLGVMREMVRQGYCMCAIGRPFLDATYSLTNWSGAWRGVDFGPAAAVSSTFPDVPSGEGENKDEMKTTVATTSRREASPMLMGHSRMLTAPQRYNCTIMCKTDEGYWVDFAMPDKTMARIEEYLKSDPTLSKF